MRDGEAEAERQQYSHTGTQAQKKRAQASICLSIMRGQTHKIPVLCPDSLIARINPIDRTDIFILLVQSIRLKSIFFFLKIKYERMTRAHIDSTDTFHNLWGPTVVGREDEPGKRWVRDRGVAGVECRTRVMSA